MGKPFMSLKQHMIYHMLIVLGIGVIVGLLVGYYGSPKSHIDPRFTPASQAEIAKALADVTQQFEAKSSTECKDTTDPIKPQDRVAVFKKYLKVNRFANRAVIRGCNDIDGLLAKGVDGKWFRTTVNVSLDKRAAKLWQAECLIDDITVADDKVRPENTTIDVFNLVYCRKLSEQELVTQYLHQAYDSQGLKVDKNMVDEFLKGAERL